MAVGDIGAVIDSLEFDSVDCLDPAIIHISGEVYAVVYQGPDTDGWLKTFTIDSDGQIGAAVIDSYEFEGVQCLNPVVLNIEGDVYAIFYGGPSTDGWIKTVEIAVNGQITEPFIDSMEFDVGLTYEVDVAWVAGNIYAIVYRNIGNDGALVTVTISDNGQINDVVTDSWVITGGDSYFNKILRVGGSVFAVAGKNADSDCYIKTVTILADGTITESIIDTYVFHAGTFYELEFTKISDNVYAVLYQDELNDGWITTVEIGANGQITEPFIDRYEYGADTARQSNVIPVSEGVYVVAFWGVDDDGWIKTVEIAANGQITEPFIDSLEFDVSIGTTPALIHVTGNIYAVAYRGVDADGWFKTFDIETQPPCRMQHGLMMGVG